MTTRHEATHEQGGWLQYARWAVVAVLALGATVVGGPSAGIVVGVLAGLLVFRRSYVYAVLLALFCLLATAVCTLLGFAARADLFASDAFGLLLGAVVVGLVGPEWPFIASDSRP